MKSKNFETPLTLLALKSLKEMEQKHTFIGNKSIKDLTSWEVGVVHVWKIYVEFRISEFRKQGYFKQTRGSYER